MGVFNQFLIWADTSITPVNFLSVTSQAGPVPGNVVASTSNLGRMQAGSGTIGNGALGAAAVPVRLVITQAGGVGGGSFGWRPESGSDTKVRGVHDPRLMWGHHSPRASRVTSPSTTPGPRNCAHAWDPIGQRLVVMGAVSGATTLYWSTSLATDAYDVWTAQSNATLVQSAGGNNGGAAITLPDGSILYAIVVDDRRTGTSYDVDLYLLKAGTNTWTCVAQSIIQRFSNVTIAWDITATIRLARSGEMIRLAIPNSSGVLVHFSSSDRGSSWKRLEDGPTVFDNGDTDDPYPYDMIGVGDSGEFHLVYATTADDYQHGVAFNEATFYNSVFGQRTTVLAEIKCLILCEDPAFVNCYAFYSDNGASNADGWLMERAPRGSAGNLLYSYGGWEGVVGSSTLATMASPDGCDRYPMRCRATWAGDRMAFYGGTKGETSTADSGSFGCMFYIGGWTRYPVFGQYWTDAFYGGSFFSGGNAGTAWNNTHGSPENMAGSGWVQTVVGASNTSSDDTVTITGTAAGQTDYWTHPLSTGAGYAFALANRFVMRVDSADSATAADNVAVKYFCVSGAARVRLTLRIGSTTVVLRDDVAAANLGTLTLNQDTGINGGFTEVVVGIYPNGGGTPDIIVKAYNHGTGDTATIGPFTPATELSAAAGQIQFGHLGQTQATTMRSWWREFGWVLANSISSYNCVGITSTDGLLAGLPMSSTPIHVADNLTVYWGGFGGALGDYFTTSVDYTYGIKNPLSIGTSPQIVWRSTSMVAQTLILDLGATNTSNRAVHTAAAIKGYNGSTIIVDYDTASGFASPSGGGTIDFRAFGTDSTPLTVNAVTGNVIVFAADDRIVAGDLLGMIIRPTSGAAAGLSFRVTKHDTNTVVQCEGETTLSGLTSSHTCAVLSPDAFLIYSTTSPRERYVRLRMTDTDTPEGYHKLGAVMLGVAQQLDAEIQWTMTDTETANNTEFRARNGMSWAQEDGPPIRIISGLIQGDNAAHRTRDQIRAHLRRQKYNVAPVVLAYDQNNTWDMLFGTIRETPFDQQGYSQDGGLIYRAAGDMQIQITEKT